MRASRRPRRDRLDHQRFVQERHLPADRATPRVLIGVLQAATHGAPGRRDSRSIRCPANQISPHLDVDAMMVLPSVDFHNRFADHPKTSPASGRTRRRHRLDRADAPVERAAHGKVDRRSRTPRSGAGSGQDRRLMGLRDADGSSAPNARTELVEPAGALRARPQPARNGVETAAAGGAISTGTSPGIPLAVPSARGKAGQQLFRIGMGGAAKKRSTGADSTSCPAYMTLTASQIS